MGYILTSVYDLVEMHVKNEPIAVLPGEPGHTWGGRIYVDEIEIKPKIDWRTTLVSATQEGNLEVVRLLLDGRADVNGTDEVGDERAGPGPTFSPWLPSRAPSSGPG
jgi:hypothetical protein